MALVTIYDINETELVKKEFEGSETILDIKKALNPKEPHTISLTFRGKILNDSTPLDSLGESVSFILRTESDDSYRYNETALDDFMYGSEESVSVDWEDNPLEGKLLSDAKINYEKIEVEDKLLEDFVCSFEDAEISNKGGEDKLLENTFKDPNINDEKTNYEDKPLEDAFKDPNINDEGEEYLQNNLGNEKREDISKRVDEISCGEESNNCKFTKHIVFDEGNAASVNENLPGDIEMREIDQNDQEKILGIVDNQEYLQHAAVPMGEGNNNNKEYKIGGILQKGKKSGGKKVKINGEEKDVNPSDIFTINGKEYFIKRRKKRMTLRYLISQFENMFSRALLFQCILLLFILRSQNIFLLILIISIRILRMCSNLVLTNKIARNITNHLLKTIFLFFSSLLLIDHESFNFSENDL